MFLTLWYKKAKHCYISMTVLLPDTATEQTYKFIPFIQPTENLNITKIDFLDEQTNTNAEAVLGTFSTVSFYNEVNLTIPLIEGRFYMAIFYDGTTEIFRDKVFATAQPIETFSVNAGVYEYGPSTPNEYILYEQ